jgi:hypothetical protein
MKEGGFLVLVPSTPNQPVNLVDELLEQLDEKGCHGSPCGLKERLQLRCETPRDIGEESRELWTL